MKAVRIEWTASWLNNLFKQPEDSSVITHCFLDHEQPCRTTSCRNDQQVYTCCAVHPGRGEGQPSIQCNCTVDDSVIPKGERNIGSSANSQAIVGSLIGQPGLTSCASHQSLINATNRVCRSRQDPTTLTSDHADSSVTGLMTRGSDYIGHPVNATQCEAHLDGIDFSFVLVVEGCDGLRDVGHFNRLRHAKQHKQRLIKHINSHCQVLDIDALNEAGQNGNTVPAQAKCGLQELGLEYEGAKCGVQELGLEYERTENALLLMGWDQEVNEKHGPQAIVKFDTLGLMALMSVFTSGKSSGAIAGSLMNGGKWDINGSLG